MFTMSEAERRLNQRDLDSFKKASNALDSKLPGMAARPEAHARLHSKSFHSKKPLQFESPIPKRELRRNFNQPNLERDISAEESVRSKSTTPFGNVRSRMGVGKSMDLGNPRASAFGPAAGQVNSQNRSVFSKNAARVLY
jgi:hypothetical protein